MTGPVGEHCAWRIVCRNLSRLIQKQLPKKNVVFEDFMIDNDCVKY